MKSLAIGIASAVIVLTPAVAQACNYEPICTLWKTSDKWGSGYDDPNIPNCVAGPDKNYAEGQCEHVQIWLNFGNSGYDCDDREMIGRNPS
jgi:hypothetical protein